MTNIVRILKTFLLKNRPLYVHYGITYRCNLECRMCKIYRNANADEELSLHQIDRVFDAVRSLGVVYVSIGGGEPSLREDLPSVIELLRRKKFMVRLLTNATIMPERLILKLVSCGLREVSISLDSLEPQKQDSICNYNGAWEKIMTSIDYFEKYLPRKKRLILINTVVSPLNITELPALSSFAQKKGLYVSFLPVENNGIPEFEFREKDHSVIDESYEYLIEMKKKGAQHIFNSSIFLEKSCQYLKLRQLNWRCDAGKLYFSLNPKGEFSICHNFEPLFSLLHNDFRTRFFSEGFKNRRTESIRQCFGCIRPCWAELSFLMREKRSLWEMVRVGLSTRTAFT